MCKRFYVNTVKSIVNNDIRHIAGNVHTVNGDAVLLSGSYYAIAATGNPKNAPEPHNEDRAQHAYNLHFDAARVSCTKQLATPDFKALQFYERTERKAKTRRPLNFGAGMPAVNPKFLLNILEMDHAAKIYYSKPNAILYIVGDGFEAVLMPIQKPKDRPDIATDLTEYGAEPTAEPQTAEPQPVKPWFLRGDEETNADICKWGGEYHENIVNAYDEDAEPAQEMPETKPLNYTIARTAPNGKMCNYAAFATITRATANIIDFSRMQPNHDFALYRHGTFYKLYKAGKEIVNDRYAQIARETERARNEYKPPEPSSRDTIIAQTAAIMGDRIKIVKVGA